MKKEASKGEKSSASMPLDQNVSPMIQHYLDIKRTHPEHLLFYRMGDFYELFFEDAITAAQLLDLHLTRRGQANGVAIPMAGVPAHAANKYLAALVKKGRTVAVCEQMGEAAAPSGKLQMRREVVKIVTPGTLSEDELLNTSVAHALAAIFNKGNRLGFAYVDLASGYCALSEVNSTIDLETELARVKPAELLVAHCQVTDLKNPLGNLFNLTQRPDSEFELCLATRRLIQQFEVADLDNLGLSTPLVGVQAAGALLGYLQETQKRAMPHLKRFIWERPSEFVLLDPHTRRQLELTENLQGDRKNSLFELLDETATPMGSRLLSRWIHHPSRSLETLKHRQQWVLLLKSVSTEIKTLLKKIGDIERAITRIALRTAKPKDFLRVRQTLGLIPELKVIVKSLSAKTLNINAFSPSRLAEYAQLHTLLIQAICQQPAANLRDGNVIASGYSKELDEWRLIANEDQVYLEELLAQERQELKLDSLKVGHSSVHGYFFQLSKTQAALAPSHFKRKQTLKQAERFTTEALQTFEKKVVVAKARVVALEKQLYDQLFELCVPFITHLQSVTKFIAKLDVLSCFAQQAVSYKYVCPTLRNDRGIYLKNARHPIVEKALREVFTPNSLTLDSANEMWILTGPNMGGKSTYMRQTAIIVIMAQIGSFVPAEVATIGLVDQIFTRIGASDDLAGGRSTFMVEMTEVANLMHRATQESLVLIDEVGRGTSTGEGLALAWAIAWELSSKLHPLTIFSTHYQEVTKLAQYFDHVHCCQVRAVTYKNQVTFLHEVVTGVSTSSYAIAVAKLAGLPSSVLEKATACLYGKTPWIVEN